MKGLLKALLMMTAAVLVLAAVFLTLLFTPTVQVSQGVVLTAVEPVEISSVQVQNATGKYRYYYENDGYVLDDIPGTLVDLDAFIAFMTDCGQLSAAEKVGEGDLARYGLDTPAATVDLQFFEGNPLHITFGTQEKISGDYYVAAEGFPGVYLMRGAMAEPFFRPKTQVIRKLVTPALGVSSPLSAIRDITFTGGPLEKPVSIQATSGGDADVRKAALSFGTATHLVRGVGCFQLDQTYGVEMLGSLFAIPGKDLVGYQLTQAQTDALGFRTPWMTVEYDMVNGPSASQEHCVLEIARQEDGSFYAMQKGSGLVYQIDPQPFMGIQYDKLLLRWFCSPMLMDVAAITVEGGGAAYRFAVDNTDGKNPVVTSDGNPVDTQLFRSFFRLVTSAAHDGNYLGQLPSPQGEAVLTLTYEYNSPGKAPDVLAFYPGQVRRAQVFVNGAGEFAIKDQFITRVLEACPRLLAGEPIEEKW